MKVSGAIITGLMVCFLFMFLGCQESPTSLEDQKANLETLNKYGERGGGGGGNGGIPDPDPDSDRPPWAGGNTGENPHQNPNPDAGDKRGEDYGDLWIIYRDVDGAPICTLIYDPKVEEPTEDDLIEVVQPIAFLVAGYDVDGNPILAVDPDGIPVEAMDGDNFILMEWSAEGEIMPPADLGYDVAVCEVDLGRLNLIRAPKSRLDQALEEAVGALNAPNVATISVDFCGRITAIYDDLNLETEDPLDHLMKTIDSPRENMALYRELMANGFTGVLSFIPEKFHVPEGQVLDLEVLKFDLAASAFGAGSDKTGYVCIDEIVYCNTFLNLNESDYARYVGYTSYNRNRYENRYIKMYWPDFPNGTPPEEPLVTSIFAAQPQYFHFNAKWGEGPSWDNVAAFRTAVDDAVQVLDFIHGDTTIEFVWPWEELFPPTL